MRKLRKFTFTVLGSIVVYETLRKTGALDKIKGSLKNKAGRILQDPKLQFEGSYDKGKGVVKEVSQEVKDEVEDLFDNEA